MSAAVLCRVAPAERHRWHLFTVTDIPGRSNPTTYLRRFRILSTPWFGIYLHKILREDEGPDMHDHPWASFGVILLGGYHEEEPADPLLYGPKRIRRRRVGSWRRMRADTMHRIARLFRVPTWSLFLVGPRTQTWGFRIPAPDDPRIAARTDWRSYLGLPSCQDTNR